MGPDNVGDADASLKTLLGAIVVGSSGDKMRTEFNDLGLDWADTSPEGVVVHTCRLDHCIDRVLSSGDLSQIAKRFVAATATPSGLANSGLDASEGCNIEQLLRSDT